MRYFKKVPLANALFFAALAFSVLTGTVFAALVGPPPGGGGGPGAAPAAWFDTDWQFRKSITIDSTKVLADETDFPVLLSLVDADFSSEAQPDGDDFVFTSDDGTTVLAHEIEVYTAADGTLVAWVKVPVLSASIDTVLYLYYGNSAVSTQENATAVWDSNYKGVWHLSEDPSLSTDGDCGGGSKEGCDSTSNNNDLNRRGSVSTSDLVSGQAGLAQNFDGANDSFEVTNVEQQGLNPGTLDFTMEAWIKTTGNLLTIMSKQEGNHPYEGYNFNIDSDDNFGGIECNCGGNGTMRGKVTSDDPHDVDTGAFVHVAFAKVTSDPANWKVYINGAVVPSSITANNFAVDVSPTVNFYIGSRTGDMFFKGVIDEARFSTVERDANWLETQYNNQSSPSTFYTVGSEETGPVIHFIDTVNARVGINTSTPQSAFQVVGYVQLSLTAGAPPAADCDEESEAGRMIFDAGVEALYLCSGASGWVTK